VAGTLFAGACSGDAPSPEQDILPTSSHVWVDVVRDGSEENCFISMPHVLNELVVVDVLGAADRDMCLEGDQIKEGQISETHNDVLEQERDTWRAVLDEIEQKVTDGQDDSALEVVERTGVMQVGRYELGDDGYTELQLFDGHDDTVPFGPEGCTLHALAGEDAAAASPRPNKLKTFGEVEYEGDPHVLARVSYPGDSGATCSGGDLVLIPAGGGSGSSDQDSQV